MSASIPSRRGPLHQGFTLVELLVAMVLGIIVSGGIISLFASTSRANRVQASLAHMQENGRFAVSRLVDDLRMTNGQYCSNSGGVPSNSGSVAGGSSVDGNHAWFLQDFQRAPTIFLAPTSVNFANLLPVNTFNPAATSSVPYPMPSGYFMRGYECSGGSCTPTAPTAGQGIPDTGTTAGKRIPGTDILTVRYLQGKGWSLDAGASQQFPASTATSDTTLTSIVLARNATTNEPYVSEFTGDIAMITECSKTQIFAVKHAAGNTLIPDTGRNFSLPVGVPQPVLASRSPTADPRLHDFTRDFVTVTYFLELRADDNPDAPANHLIGVLMRKVNNAPAEELVRGVERLDFRYGVDMSNGTTAYLTADQVDNRASGTLICPAGPKDAITEAGCLWRAVKSIELSLLLDSVDQLAMPDGELAYQYPPDGASVQTPPSTMTNGLSRQMMRRGFTAVVGVRNHF
ncbi:MAG TPA: PilW family protein [Rhodanobacteraceae bacterium]|nr:PilW family protein [Rhodanobacteraceae bacterium]